MTEIGPDELKALDRALEPTASEVDRHVRGALARAKRLDRGSRAPRAAVAAVAAVAVAVAVAAVLVAVRSAPVAGPIVAGAGWSVAREGLSFSGDGHGQLVGAGRIEWEAGQLVVSLEPGTGPLEVATADALVRVVGTVFSVDRGEFGTVVEVSRGKVEVTCRSGGGRALAVGEIAVCAPDAASALAIASRPGDRPEVRLAAVDDGLRLHPSAPVEQALLGVRVEALVRAGDLDAAASAASALDPELPTGRHALWAVVDARPGCASRPALDRLAAVDPAAAIQLTACVPDRAGQRSILERARGRATPEQRQVIEQWLHALERSGAPH